MAISATRSSGSQCRFLLLITLLIFSPICSISSDDTEDEQIVAELLSLQSHSSTGIIHLSDQLFRRLLSPTPRSFSLIIFFDAQQLHSNSQLQLQALKSEFSLLATSFIANSKGTPTASKLFFCDIEFKESQSTFNQFGVSALPHIRLVPPTARDLKSDSIQMDAGDFSRLAESMAEFIQSKTSLTVGHIHRPPMISRNQVILFILFILICSPFLVKKVMAGETLLHDWKIWMAGAVFVYFFSVAGTMHNIIRKMPMFLADKDDPSKLIFFYQGSGMQLGAEGFAVGFLYTVVGLLLALTTHVLVRVRNRTAQRLVMFSALIISFWAVKKVIFLDNWKTGYGIHAYWPSSW